MALISQRLEIATSELEIGTNKKMLMRELPLLTPVPRVIKLIRLRTANQCYQQAAELSGDLGEYQKSMELYQTVADWSLTSALTKYSVKEYWLRAAMCSMAMGVSLLISFFLPLSSRPLAHQLIYLGPSNYPKITRRFRSKRRHIPFYTRS